jgi:hypothetical protein
MPGVCDGLTVLDLSWGTAFARSGCSRRPRGRRSRPRSRRRGTPHRPGPAARAWWSELDAAGVAAEVVDENFCHTLLDDPHARAVGLVRETWAPGVGRFEDPGLLIDFSETPGAVPRGPCLCGEHTRELLREHGYSDDEIDALAADGAVLDAPRVRMSA